MPLTTQKTAAMSMDSEDKLGTFCAYIKDMKINDGENEKYTKNIILQIIIIILYLLNTITEKDE